MQEPRKPHLEAVRRIMRYIKGSADYGLLYRKGKYELTGYCDADFAGDKETRRSTSGILITVCGAAIFASSKRQPIVADSTVAAETIALYSLVKEVMWLRNFLEWLGYPQQSPTSLWCDNAGAVCNCEDGAERHKTKHLDIKYIFSGMQSEKD